MRFSLCCCALAVSLVAVAGCGANAGTGAAQQPGTGSGGATSPMAGDTPAAGGDGAGGATNPDCTRATKVTIVEKASAGMGDTYSFSPGKVTIKRGGYLAITNRSDEVHALVSTPDAGIVTSAIDKKERQVIQFPQAGTFTVQSANAAHRAVLQLTVSGDSGCGAPAQSLAITEVTAAAGDQYSFTPKALTVAPAANFTVVNKSDATHTIRCTPDAGGNRDNSTLDKGESQVLAFDKPGAYSCASTQHPAAKVTITVAQS
ncbi:MAG TPA: plastocyanin/azurin family copper-binding protein [Rugosimonospora sp.]|nr:plastocyanin/azurin family copper-binding protein [Rugosimonospora sp.]